MSIKIKIRKKDGMFGSRKSSKASKMIRIDSPENAKKSVRWLSEEWKKAKTRRQKVKLRRYANEARNIALVFTERKDISEKEKREMREVAKIYSEWLKKHPLPPKKR